jgi:hypothetical protein
VRRVLATAGACLALWTAAVGVALSFNGVGPPYAVSNPLAIGAPQTYHDIEYATSFIPTAVSMLVGHPVITSAQGAPLPGNYLSLAQGGTPFSVGNAPTIVKIVSPKRERIQLGANVFPPAPLDGTVVLTAQWGDPAGISRFTLQGPGPVRLPVELRRGLNEIQLSASRIPAPRSSNKSPQVQVQVHALKIANG